MNSSIHTIHTIHTIRERVLQIHRWTGITIGLLVVLVATTGAAMVFRPQLDPVINRSLLKVEPCSARLPLDTLVANARAANPGGGALTFMRIYGEADASTHVRLSDDNWVYLNPCTGAVLGQEHRYRGVFGTLDFLHRFKYVKNSSIYSGTVALAFAVLLILGGLFVWWPATMRALKTTLKPNLRVSGRAYSLTLHKTLALYVSPIVLVSALTGIPQAFEWCQNALLTVTGSPLPAPTPKSTPTAGGQRLPVEAYWQRAQELVPQPSAVLFRYPKKPNDPVEFELIGRDAPHAAARTYLDLDAYSGKALRFEPYAEASLGHRLFLWMVAWHTGLLGGVLGQLLLLSGALSVPVVAYLGISSYVRGKFRPRTVGTTSAAGAPDDA
jgi:uncharacterized iron-regulated membrane protein